MAFRVSVDRDACIGSGLCLARISAVFDQSDDDGLVVLLDATPGPEMHEAVRDAADHCPSGAITVSEGGPDPPA
jgi:ferredoxin